MNAAVLGGLVEQWVWRCQMIATQYQLRQPINLQTEVARLVEQAETEARRLAASRSGLPLQGREQARYQRAYRGAAGASRPREADRSRRKSLGRAKALHAFADAFGIAAERLRPQVSGAAN